MNELLLSLILVPLFGFCGAYIGFSLAWHVRDKQSAIKRKQLLNRLQGC